jgi:hypothetical protein
MKIIYVLLFSFLLISPLFSLTQQDEDNIAYLNELDTNIISTIDLLGVFNNTACNMIETIMGAEDFSRYLMDLTLECAAMRTIITETGDLAELQRDDAIRQVWDYIKPHAIEYTDIISKDADHKNQLLLDEQYITYQDKINKLRNSIIKEEKIIKKNHQITQKYLALHNQHFIYHLILDFIKDHQYLSCANRQYLVDLIEAVEEAISQSIK